MKKKRTGRTRLWVSLLMLVLAAVLAFYYFNPGGQQDDGWAPVGREPTPAGQESRALDRETAAPAGPKETHAIKGTDQDAPGAAPADEPQDPCREVGEDVRAFFGYLDKKAYVQHLAEGVDTYEHFRGILERLSGHPPIPAGEGIDPKIISKNIFHFFRVLDRNDLRLIKEVLKNEADTLEMNFDLFYTWLIQANQCPDPDGIHPPLENLYHYAGFFLNSIGGRAYLFRRATALRLLVSYYALLIIHEADKRGKNSYGIDILPHISAVEEEMTMYPDFHFKEDYIRTLKGLSDYYLKKR